MTVTPLLIARFIIVLAGIATIKLQAVFLEPHQVGLVSLVTTALSGIVMLLVSPCGNFVTRYAHSWISSNQLKLQLTHYLRFLLAITVVTYLTVFLASLFHFFDQSIMPFYTLLIVITSWVLVTPLSSAIINCHLIAGHLLIYGALSSLQAILVPATAFLLVYLTSTNTADIWLLGIGIAPLLVGIVSWISLRSFRTPFLSIDPTGAASKQFNLKQVWPFAAPLVIGILAWWSQTQLFRVLLASIGSTGNLGLVTIAFSVAYAPLTALESILSELYMPKWLKKLSVLTESTERRKLFADYMWQPLQILSFAAVFVVLFGSDLVEVFASNQYQNSSSFVFYGCLAFITQHMFKNANLYFHGEERTHATVLPALAGLVLFCVFMIFSYKSRIWELVLWGSILGPLTGFGFVYYKIDRNGSIFLGPLRSVVKGCIWTLPLVGLKLALQLLYVNSALLISLRNLFIGGFLSCILIFLMLKSLRTNNA